MPKRAAFVVASTLVTLLLATSCGNNNVDRPRRSTPRPDTSTLVFSLRDGSTFEPTSAKVRCVPSDYGHGVQVVEAGAVSKQFNFLVDVVPADVSGGRTFKLPINSGDEDLGPKNAFLFFARRKPDVETSTDEEEATGTLRVDHASCNPASLELTVDAQLGSEYFDGERVAAKGHLVVHE